MDAFYDNDELLLITSSVNDALDIGILFQRLYDKGIEVELGGSGEEVSLTINIGKLVARQEKK
jgi:hypothetical protein